jgi:AcrR family transcriptional regulator
MAPRSTTVVRAEEPAKKTAARGEPIVKDVLAATLEELGRVGYRALRIEDVAARANVHKTTIYRRWPEKADLVRETLQTMFDERTSAPDTGSLRGDLLEIGNQVLTLASSGYGQALIRMAMTEGASGDLREIVDSVRSRKDAMRRKILDRARARGELRPEVDGELLMTTLVGSIHHSIFAMGCAPSAIDVTALVELLVFGAGVPGKV